MTNLLGDDGMKVEELFARASVDESDNLTLNNKPEKGRVQERLIINK